MNYGSKVFYDVDTNAYIVNGDASGTVIEIGEVVGMDTDFGANAGKETIRVEWFSLKTNNSKHIHTYTRRKNLQVNTQF